MHSRQFDYIRVLSTNFYHSASNSVTSHFVVSPCLTSVELCDTTPHYTALHGIMSHVIPPHDTIPDHVLLAIHEFARYAAACRVNCIACVDSICSHVLPRDIAVKGAVVDRVASIRCRSFTFARYSCFILRASRCIAYHRNIVPFIAYHVRMLDGIALKVAAISRIHVLHSGTLL